MIKKTANAQVSDTIIIMTTKLQLERISGSFFGLTCQLEQLLDKYIRNVCLTKNELLISHNYCVLIRSHRPDDNFTMPEQLLFYIYVVILCNRMVYIKCVTMPLFMMYSSQMLCAKLLTNVSYLSLLASEQALRSKCCTTYICNILLITMLPLNASINALTHLCAQKCMCTTIECMTVFDAIRCTYTLTAVHSRSQMQSKTTKFMLLKCVVQTAVVLLHFQ